MFRKLALANSLAIGIASVSVGALAAPRVLVAQDSAISLTIKQMGVPVPGKFRKFEATIDIDAAHPENSRALVRVDVGSIDTGNEEADAIAAGPDWLDKARAPFAVFRSTSIRATAPGRYEARGSLSIRNQERDVALQFVSAEQADGRLLITGDFTIERSQFGIGSGIWNQPGVVAEAVPVKIRLLLAPAAGAPGAIMSANPLRGWFAVVMPLLRRVLWLGVCGVLLSCTAPAPSRPPAGSAPVGDQSTLASVYAAQAGAGGKVMALDAAASAIRIYAFRGGTVPKVGHNHVVSVPDFTGFFYLPADGTRGARFDIEFRLDQLEFDRPELRAALGPAFASQVTPEMAAASRANMLGQDNLQADLFPLVRIHSLAITGDVPRFAARIQIQLHGQQRELWVPLEVNGLPERIAVQGGFVLRQTDFDVKPFTVLGGLLAVEDELVVEFNLVGGGP